MNTSGGSCGLRTGGGSCGQCRVGKHAGAPRLKQHYREHGGGRRVGKHAGVPRLKQHRGSIVEGAAWGSTPGAPPKASALGASQGLHVALKARAKSPGVDPPAEAALAEAARLAHGERRRQDGQDGQGGITPELEPHPVREPGSYHPVRLPPRHHRRSRLLPPRVAHPGLVHAAPVVVVGEALAAELAEPVALPARASSPRAPTWRCPAAPAPSPATSSAPSFPPTSSACPSCLRTARHQRSAAAVP